MPRLVPVAGALLLAFGIAYAQEPSDSIPLRNWPVPFDEVARSVPETDPLRIANRSLRPGTESVPASASTFIALTPCRVYDSRVAAGGPGPIPSAATRTVQIAGGPCAGVPATATGFSLNLTVTGSPAGSNYAFITAYPTGSTWPGAATLNFLAGTQVGNAAIVPAGTAGAIDLYASLQTDVIVDINGYFAGGVVTSLTAGTGLTGGGSGDITLGIAAGGVGTNELADGSVTDVKLTTITTPGRVANSATTGASGNAANTLVLRDGGGNFGAGTITLNGNLNLPSTTSALSGSIALNGNSFLHAYGGAGNNTFLGLQAGNYTMSSGGFGASASTGIGYYALNALSTGYYNTALGAEALKADSTGYGNTGLGFNALHVVTTGLDNTATGAYALAQTTGNANTAMGYGTMYFNAGGGPNAAFGSDALYMNTAGNYNTALGTNALFSCTGNTNIGVGHQAGTYLTTGNLNIDIGNGGVAAESGTIRIGTAASQTRAFMAGIRGVATGNADAIAVYIDSAGQLGTASSSRRYKFDIEDMGSSTDGLMRLRPVTFRYRQYGASAPLQYGLVAEEVADIYPELVVRDEDGQPQTVLYQFLAPMLLNEAQKQRKEIDALRTENMDLRAANDDLRARLERLERLIEKK